jgi:hypothetical protein
MDFTSGDLVDVTQILKVASGVNVVSGGYLRVTTSGLIQVDLDGGADHWVTLSTVNGTGNVAVRYLLGGVATNVSVARVTDASLAMSASQLSDHTLGGPAPMLHSHDFWSGAHHFAFDNLGFGTDLPAHLYEMMPFAS